MERLRRVCHTDVRLFVMDYIDDVATGIAAGKCNRNAVVTCEPASTRVLSTRDRCLTLQPRLAQTAKRVASDRRTADGRKRVEKHLKSRSFKTI